MKIAVIAITHKGADLGLKIGLALKGDVYLKQRAPLEKWCREHGEFPLKAEVFSNSLGDLVEKIFYAYEGLVFIMACGIVVRSIAPYLKGKTKDPGVVVLDEKGSFAISLLSGHIGGANRLAEKISVITGCTPVITTATDVNKVISFDLYAMDNNCIIENIEDLKYISSTLVNGGSVGLYTDCKVKSEFSSNIIQIGTCPMVVAITNSMDIPVKAERLLILRPKNLYLGIGCKKGKRKEEIENAVMRYLEENKKSILSVKKVSSIDLKREEKGIIEFCKERGIQFVTHIVEDIKSIEDKFTTSDFVKQITGVGNVAQPCAVLAGENARIICSKKAFDGITLALAEEEFFV